MFVAGLPPAVIFRCKIKEPVKKLKSAPRSKASLTPKPKATPGRVKRAHQRRPVLGAAAPKARKFSPKQIGWPAPPQHAVDKKSPFNAATNPPRKQASREKFHCRKQNQALRPRKNSAKGA